jgi:N-acetylmuramoyl-L-alanine amidase
MALRDGTTEVHVAWDVALRLRRLLEARGIAVGMTKSAERQLVRNRDRALIANAMHAALMVRLHCDSGGGRGFALYYPDRQGRSGGAVGPPVAVREASRRAAQVLLGVMTHDLSGQIPGRGVKGDTRTRVGGRQGALTGSVYARVPVVTIEMAVLTNGRDAAFMRTEAGREAMARAIADGVERFVRSPG